MGSNKVTCLRRPSGHRHTASPPVASTMPAGDGQCLWLCTATPPVLVKASISVRLSVMRRARRPTSADCNRSADGALDDRPRLLFSVLFLCVIFCACVAPEQIQDGGHVNRNNSTVSKYLSPSSAFRTRPPFLPSTVLSITDTHYAHHG